MAQYRAGKQDHLAHRLARRDAHNADAALSGALSAVFQEPFYMRRNAGAGTHFLVLSHTLLNYLSALGAHRDTLQLVLPDDASAHAASHLLATLDARAPRGQAGRRTRVAGTTGLVPALAARAV